MIRALQLVFLPFKTWEKIAAAKSGIFAVLAISVLPLLVFSSAIEGYGLVCWGDSRGEFGRMALVSQSLAMRYELLLVVMNLAGMFLGAWLLYNGAQSFDFLTTYTQAFTTIAYGFTPIFLTRLLDTWPSVNTWVCWGVGAVLSFSILYHGVAQVMKPDQTKGFGMYLFAALIVVFASGLAHFIALSVLQATILP